MELRQEVTQRTLETRGKRTRPPVLPNIGRCTIMNLLGVVAIGDYIHSLITLNISL